MRRKERRKDENELSFQEHHKAIVLQEELIQLFNLITRRFSLPLSSQILRFHSLDFIAFRRKQIKGRRAREKKEREEGEERSDSFFSHHPPHL